MPFHSAAMIRNCKPLPLKPMLKPYRVWCVKASTVTTKKTPCASWKSEFTAAAAFQLAHGVKIGVGSTDVIAADQICSLADEPPPPDGLALLCEFARANLKGKERAAVEALCASQGELSIGDLAFRLDVESTAPEKHFKDVQRRLNPKLKALGWILQRQNNAAQLKGAKEGLKST